VLKGLYRFHATQARLSTAEELAQQLFHLAQRQHDATIFQEAHLALGTVTLFRGDLVTARAHLEHSLHLSDPWQPSRQTFGGGHDSRVQNLVWLALALWGLGYADQALQRSEEALALAQQGEHTPTLAFAAVHATVLSQCRRDVAGTHARADAVMADAVAQGLAHRVGHGRILWGWALAMRGDAVAGVVQIRQGIAVSQGEGLNLWRPYMLALLAEAYGQARQPEAGLQVLAEALTLVAATEERWWEAELYRLQGDLLLHLPSPDVFQAEASFHQALDVARRQQAKALELRAAMSLSRLWQQQAQRTEARQLLADIYRWFTEGFATADLQTAKALLEELA
jgi:predicted ATPase